MPLSIDPSRFILPRGVAYLDTAAEGIPPVAALDGLHAYWRAKSMGSPGRELLYRECAALQNSAARLLSASPDDIVPLANASVGLNLLADGIDWKPGDEALICDLEFPSNVVVWLRLKDRGVRVSVVPSVDGVVRLEDWLSRLTPRTRIVSVSQVSYKTGSHLPYLEELASHVRAAGAIFCVDATQALGRVPVSVAGVDYLVASSYKWMLGTHGLGLVYRAPHLRDMLTASTAGWHSVEELFHPERFASFTAKSSAGQLQAGMPNFPAIYALRAGIDCVLSVGVETIHRELRPLMDELREGLLDCGLPLLTPRDPAYASGIIAFACPEAPAVVSALAERGVVVWGGDGRVRVSVHLYNSSDDVARCVTALRELVPA